MFILYTEISCLFRWIRPPQKQGGGGNPHRPTWGRHVSSASLKSRISSAPMCRSWWPACDTTQKGSVCPWCELTMVTFRCWFQMFFIFTPKIGERIQFDEHIFQMGWNHQLVTLFWQNFIFFWWYFEGFEGFVTFVKRCLIHFWFWFLTNLGVWCSCLLSTTKVCVFEFCTTTTRDPTKGTSSNSLSATLTSHFGALEGKDRIKFRVLRFDTMAPGLPRVSSQRRGFQPANPVTVTLPSTTFTWRIFWSTGDDSGTPG